MAALISGPATDEEEPAWMNSTPKLIPREEPFEPKNLFLNKLLDEEIGEEDAGGQFRRSGLRIPTSKL